MWSFGPLIAASSGFCFGSDPKQNPEDAVISGPKLSPKNSTKSPPGGPRGPPRAPKFPKIKIFLNFFLDFNSLLLDLAGRPRTRGLEGSAPRGAVNPLNYGNSLKLTKVIVRGPQVDTITGAMPFASASIKL